MGIKQVRDSEPVALSATVTALITAVAGLLMVYGVFSEQEAAAWIAVATAFVGVASAAGLGAWARSKVSPVSPAE